MSWDKNWMRRSFDRAAKSYDRLAGLQRQIGERLLGNLPQTVAPGWLLDIGAGTGWCAHQLSRRYPGRPLMLVDIAEGMLQRARRRQWGRAAGFVVGDAETLPLADDCCGLIVSNLALQWCLKPEQAFAEMGRILPPGGVLLFSTFAAGTLEELRQAWRQVDDYSHVNPFVEPERLIQCLSRAGFSHWRLERESISLPYASVRALLHEIKGIGAHNVTLDRPRHLLGKGALESLENAYPGRSDGIRASFVPVYGVAVK